jgi:DNA-directed RNA polymerase specialized sigma24 family protein
VTKNHHIPWPSLETAYLDEFGQIETDVYLVASGLWRQAESYALRVLQDAQTGQILLLKATALVSRVKRESPKQIDNLQAYLYSTFKRLVLAQLEKENGHRKLEVEHLSQLPQPGESLSVDVDRKILIQQIMRSMESWMLEVFELLVLGHTFEEIAPRFNQSAHVLRTRYSKSLKKLTKQILAETLDAEKKGSRH